MPGRLNFLEDRIGARVAAAVVFGLAGASSRRIVKSARAYDHGGVFHPATLRANTPSCPTLPDHTGSCMPPTLCAHWCHETGLNPGSKAVEPLEPPQKAHLVQGMRLQALFQDGHGQLQGSVFLLREGFLDREAGGYKIPSKSDPRCCARSMLHFWLCASRS